MWSSLTRYVWWLFEQIRRDHPNSHLTVTIRTVVLSVMLKPNLTRPRKQVVGDCFCVECLMHQRSLETMGDWIRRFLPL